MFILLSVMILFSLHKLRFAKLSSQNTFILRTLPEMKEQPGLENDASSEPPGFRTGKLLCALYFYFLLMKTEFCAKCMSNTLY